ncbi:hypothetical protein [Amycolatopsis magusensis]|uniref:hypothetical protein n=1 Tax=Amycolatopsis magusensis TaxID=882444 RepID=UPI003C2CE75E
MAEDTYVGSQSHAEVGGASPSPPAAGDAGNSFISNMLSGLDPMDTESVQQFNADAQKVKDLGTAGPGGGGFALEPEAGQKFIAAIDSFIDVNWNKVRDGLNRLGQRPELGDGPYAERVAAHDLEVMDSDDQSLAPNLRLLKDSLVLLREGVDAAIKSYSVEDEANSISFKVMKGE